MWRKSIKNERRARLFFSCNFRYPSYCVRKPARCLSAHFYADLWNFLRARPHQRTGSAEHLVRKRFRDAANATVLPPFLSQCAGSALFPATYVIATDASEGVSADLTAAAALIGELKLLQQVLEPDTPTVALVLQVRRLTVQSAARVQRLHRSSRSFERSDLEPDRGSVKRDRVGKNPCTSS